jgi:hypothetical protein
MNALYGQPAQPASATAAAAVPTPAQTGKIATLQTAAEGLYQEKPPVSLAVPDEVARLRAESHGAADTLFADSVEPSIATYLNPLAESGMPGEVRQAVGGELTRMARDIGLDGAGIGQLIGRGALAEVRDMTPEQAAANRITAMSLLKSEFGDRAEQAMQDATRLARRDPRMAQMLVRSRLGDDPQTILTFARLAARQRGAGRLK